MSTTHYILGSSLTDTDISYVHSKHSIIRKNKSLYFGSDYGLEELENLLPHVANKTEMQQIFVIGSAAFPLMFLQTEESFLRRFPHLSFYLKRATDGTERDAYSMHKKYKNIHLYIINLYTVHESNLILHL